MDEQFSSLDPTTVVVPCPLASQPVGTHWIEIELLGEDDSTIPYEEYRVTLPNQDVVRGFLDDSGWARVDNIPTAGQCAVTFPRLDRHAWLVHPESPADARKDT